MNNNTALCLLVDSVLMSQYPKDNQVPVRHFNRILFCINSLVINFLYISLQILSNIAETHHLSFMIFTYYKFSIIFIIVVVIINHHQYKVSVCTHLPGRSERTCCPKSTICKTQACQRQALYPPLSPTHKSHHGKLTDKNPMI